MELNFRVYNIQDGSGFGPPQDIQALKRGKYDLMLLKETKIPNVVYCRNHLGYDAVCSKATVTAVGGEKKGVEIMYQEKLEGWIL